MITSPASGLFLITFSFGAAAITAPTSILLATKFSSYTSATWPVERPIWLPYDEYPLAASVVIFFCISLPARVSSREVLGSADPVTLMAWYTYDLPDNGSLMAPPRQVAAPPNGSISVGWLCVSFLNIRRYSSFLPSTSTSIFIEQAFISSLSSRSASLPSFFSFFMATVAISIRHISLSLSP